MKFLTAYDRVSHSGSPCGSPEYSEARVKFSSDGNMTLEYGKTRNRQNEINSYKAACDVNMLIKRYENGDQTALLRNNTGAYADLTQVPENIHEAKKLYRNVESLYNKMGSDIKAKYTNLSEFAEAFSTKEKFNAFVKDAQSAVRKRAEAAKPKVAAKPKAEEVKTDA